MANFEVEIFQSRGLRGFPTGSLETIIMKRNYSIYIGTGYFTALFSFVCLCLFFFEYETEGHITPRAKGFYLYGDEAEFLLISLLAIFIISFIFTFYLWLYHYYHTGNNYFDEKKQAVPSASEIKEEVKYLVKETSLNPKYFFNSTLKTIGYAVLIYGGLVLLSKCS